tara:strand:+ start:714 stop:1553 length:840 start_codon:yes stop_codon:yes gene_type:complete
LAVLVALTGCEEDSYHPDSEPQVLTLNEASAPDALLEVWINAYNLVPYRLVNNLIQMRSPTNTCFSGGTASPQSDGQGRVTLIVFDACEEDFGSIGERTDGQIEYTYAAGSAPISITATDYIDHLQLSPTNSQAVTFNGTIDLPNGTAWPLSYTITGNGSYTITSADGSSAADGDFDQFTVTSTPGAGSDYTSDISGGLGLPDGGGDMQVQTGSAGLSFDSSSTCPIYGEIALTAEDRSTISVLFNGADHIVVTVNGVAQPEQDCTAFLTGIGAQVSPP